MSVAHNDACELFFEEFGVAGDPTLLMVNGLGSQCINFKDAWCEMFVAAGFHVIRFDNRDVGVSTKFTDAPLGEHGEAYRISDMGNDAVAVLDAANVARAHIMGLSMGGAIVQQIAIDHPARVITMTSVMSWTGEADFRSSSPEALKLLNSPPVTNHDDHVERWVAGQRTWGSPAYADEQRWRADAERAYARCFDPNGIARQLKAIDASGSRAEQLAQLNVPTLVIHGDCDTLIDIGAGRRTAELIPGARFEVILGMGHDYPPQLWAAWVELVAGFALSA